MLSDAELKRMLDDVMKLAGEEFEVVRGEYRHIQRAIKQTEKGTGRRYVQFYPGTDIKVGDKLVRKVSDDQWTVIEVDPHVIEGHVFCINAFYQTQKEQEKSQPQAVSFTFHNSSNIIAGTQATATINVNTEKIESEIEANGGADKAELHDMVKEIKEMFENKDAIAKGSLARFSETLEKHSWITGSLIQLLGSVAIRFFMP